MLKVGELFALLKLDKGPFDAGLGEAESKARGFGSTMVNVGTSVSRVGQSMTTNVTLPIVAAGGAVAKLGLDFDRTLNQMVGLAGVPREAIAGIREELLRLGPEIGKSPQDLAEAFYFIASAGFEADEAMVVLRASAQASAAGMGETQVIAQTLGAVINAYGKENLDAATAAGQLTEAVARGTAEADAFAGVIGRVTPTAAALGVEFHEVGAALASMTLTGLSADEAATSLNQVLVSLLKPTTEAEEALTAMGLSSAGLREQLREQGLLETLRTLEERFAGNDAAAAAVFGNVRALRGVMSLLQLDSAQLNDIFGDLAVTTGDRLATAVAETEGPSRDLERSWAELQVVAIQLSRDVIPIVVQGLKSVAGAVRGAAEWFISLPKPVREFSVQLLGLAAIAGPVILVVGKLVTGIGFLVKGLGAVNSSAALAKLGIAGLLGPIGLAAAGLTALALVGEEVSKNLNPIGFTFNQLAGQTGRSRQVIETEVRRLANELGLSGEEIQERFIKLFQAGLGWEEAVEVMRRSGGDMDAILAELPPKVGGTAEKMVDQVAEVFAAADLGPAAEQMLDPASEAAQEARDEAIEAMEAMVGGMRDVLVENEDELAEQMQALVDRLADPYTELERLTALETNLAMTAISDAINSGDASIAQDTADQVESMLDQYALLEPGALQRGELINPALQAGIDSNIESTITWLQENVIGPVTSQFELADALRELGYDGLAAYIEGQEQQRYTAWLSANTTALNTVSGLTMIDEAGDAGSGMGGAYAGGVGGQAGAAGIAGDTVAGATDASLRDLGWVNSAIAGGRAVGVGWVAGIEAGMLAHLQSLVGVQSAIAARFGGSLPEVGPFAHRMPELGGRAIGQAWTMGMEDEIIAARVSLNRAAQGTADVISLPVINAFHDWITMAEIAAQTATAISGGAVPDMLDLEALGERRYQAAYAQQTRSPSARGMITAEYIRNALNMAGLGGATPPDYALVSREELDDWIRRALSNAGKAIPEYFTEVRPLPGVKSSTSMRLPKVSPPSLRSGGFDDPRTGPGGGLNVSGNLLHIEHFEARDPAYDVDELDRRLTDRMRLRTRA